MPQVITHRRSAARKCAVASAVGLVGLALLAGSTQARDGAKDPTLSVARPPAGLPVALVGRGIDYRIDDLAVCLARDGEGLPIAWDFVDDNPLPFDAEAAETSLGLSLCKGSDISLIVARYDPAAPLGLQSALGFALQTPARIVAVPVDENLEDATRLLQIAAHSVPDRLYVAFALNAKPDTEADGRTQTMSIVVVGAQSDASAPPTPLEIRIKTAPRIEPEPASSAKPVTHPQNLEDAGAVLTSLADAWATHPTAAPAHFVKALRGLTKDGDGGKPLVPAGIHQLDAALRSALARTEPSATTVDKDAPQ